MMTETKKQICFRISLFLFGTGLLVVGGMIYITFRKASNVYFLTLLDKGFFEAFSKISFAAIPFENFSGSAPSLIHVLAFSLITAGLSKRASRNYFYIPLFWTLINLIFETLQLELFNPFFVSLKRIGFLPPFLSDYALRGTFDWHDILGCLAGAGIAVIFLRLFQGNTNKKVQTIFFKTACQNLVTSTLIVLGLLSITATSSETTCRGDDCTAGSQTTEPVYLSYEGLRSAIGVSESKMIVKAGKISLTNRYLFVNDINRGVHVFDNANPAAPEHIAFINVPGNIDIAVKDFTLFVDSFVDLVAIDIQNLPQITILKRIEDIFPYDPYQAIDDRSIFLSNVDPTQGVVIGYEAK